MMITINLPIAMIGFAMAIVVRYFLLRCPLVILFKLYSARGACEIGT
jgi:hypothetical protein